MTREDAKTYQDNLVKRLYTNEIMYEEYSRLFDEIELDPYDLSKFSRLKTETVKWINFLFRDPSETSRKGHFMLRGYTRDSGFEVRLLNLVYGDYGDCLNFYAYNDEELILYSYVEGDTTLMLFTGKEEYEQEKAETYDWYKKERCA